MTNSGSPPSHNLQYVDTNWAHLFLPRNLLSWSDSTNNPQSCCRHAVWPSMKDLAVVQKHTTYCLYEEATCQSTGYHIQMKWKYAVHVHRLSGADCRGKHHGREFKLGNRTLHSVLCFQSRNSRQLQSQHVTRIVKIKPLSADSEARSSTSEKHSGAETHAAASSDTWCNGKSNIAKQYLSRMTSCH